LGDPAVLGGVLTFVCAHEPDLVSAADALGIAPEDLVRAQGELNS
jgi:hypothetical protein